MPRRKRTSISKDAFGPGFAEFFSEIFEAQGLDYLHDVVVGSTSSDFYVEAPSGSTTIFEFKAWQPTKANLERASHQASLYRRTSGADSAFVVIPGEFASDPSSGVVSTGQFQEFIEDNVVTAPRKPGAKPPTVKPKPKDHIFASMPFSKLYDDTYLVAMKPAAIDSGFDCVRVDHEQFTGDVVAEIKRLITDGIAVVADLSDSRPNVLHEIGYAEGLGKPIVQICTDRDKLPFNVRNNKTLKYSIGQTSRLRASLGKELSSLLV
jgi:hypothetical protein